MKKILVLFGLACCLITVSVAQQRVILDADIDSDVDDVEALAMLHTMADRGEVNFLGLIVTSDDPYAAVCADAINNFFNRKRLPVGVLKSQQQLKNHSRYARQVAEEFPHRLKSHEDAKDATAIYRQLLSKSPDSSVVIITIGHLTNLQNLLLSGPDKHSELNGKELVNKKVAKWLCMGGKFPEGKEANFYRPDPASTVYCLQEWERPVVFAGWEVGEEIKTGGTYLKEKLTTKNPVYRAYELYNNFGGRSSWDQVAVFLLRDEAGNYFETISDGHCFVYKDGSNKWMPGQVSRHAYVRIKPGADPKEIGQLMDDMAIKQAETVGAK